MLSRGQLLSGNHANKSCRSSETRFIYYEEFDNHLHTFKEGHNSNVYGVVHVDLKLREWLSLQTQGADHL